MPTELDYQALLERVRDYPHLLGHMVGKTLLTDLHSEWIWEVWGGDPGENTSLQAHRGAYKTTAITEIGIIWWLLFHPNDRIALVRENWTVSNETLKTIAKYLETDGIRALFNYAHGAPPIFKTRKDGKLEFSFKTSITKEGSIDSYGVNQVPTGSHYDAILCDDFVTIKDRFSKAQRESVKEGIKEIITNIIDPGKRCMFVGTPWHRDDAWEMRNEDDDKILPDPKRYTCYDTGILSEEEIAKKRKTTTLSLFTANYELDHTQDDAQMFKDPIYGEWIHTLHKSQYFSHLDAAYGGDCTNGLTIMARRPDGKIQAYGKVFEDHIEDKLDWLYPFLVRLKAVRIYNETNPDKGFLSRLLKQPRKNMRLLVRSYNESMNKHRKIQAYLKHYWEDLVWHPDTDPEYMAQILDYKEGEKPDDAPDSAASLLREAFYPLDPESHKTALYDFD